MKLSVKLKCIVFCLLIFDVALAQDEYKILAKIGSEVITAEEYKNRFEFMPHLNYSNTNVDSVKKEFLLSLIAEKLWALEALDNSLDTLELYQNSLQTLKNLLIKDELYKKEVESKISISHEEIAEGLLYIKSVLYLNWISSSDSMEIFLIYANLKNGASFDSILSTQKKSEIPKEPMRVAYGQLRDDKIENILFNTLPGNFTEPIKTDDGFIIFKVVNEEINYAIDPATQDGKNLVLKTIHDRKAQKLGSEYIHKLLKGKSIEVNRATFNVFYEVFNSLLFRKKIIDKIPQSGFQLDDKDIFWMLSKIADDDLHKPFVLFTDKPARLKEFLYFLLYQKIVFSQLEKQEVNSVLNNAIKNFIEEQALIREAISDSLDKLPSVISDLDLWRNNYLAQLLMDKYVDSIEISDSEIEKYFLIKNSLPDTIYQVNILEILTSDLDKVEIILNELQQGKDFREVAKFYTEREWTKKSGGEFGFFPANQMGEIGKAASSLSLNEIYGPIKVQEGYSIIKLIGKREFLSDSLKNYFQENKTLLSMQLRLRKLDQIINERTVYFANKYGLKINYEILHSIQLSELNTFTYRFIGFGGKIAAFPITTPIYNWFDLYSSKNKIP